MTLREFIKLLCFCPRYTNDDYDYKRYGHL